MNLSLSKDVQTNLELLNDVILKVGYQYFSTRVDEHQMLTFPCNAWFDEECKAHLKMFKLTKDKNELKALTLYEY